MTIVVEIEIELNLEKKNCYLIDMLSNWMFLVYRLVTDIPWKGQ